MWLRADRIVPVRQPLGRWPKTGFEEVWQDYSRVGLRHVVSPRGSETPYSWTGGPPRREWRYRKVDSPALGRATARAKHQLERSGHDRPASRMEGARKQALARRSLLHATPGRIRPAGGFGYSGSAGRSSSKRGPLRLDHPRHVRARVALLERSHGGQGVDDIALRAEPYHQDAGRVVTQRLPCR